MWDDANKQKGVKCSGAHSNATKSKESQRYEKVKKKMKRTEEQIRKDLLEIDKIMEEVMHDPEVAQAAEEAQRELGTLTPEELRRRFTI